MMHADERSIACERERLRVHDADQQRSRQARARGDRYGIDGRVTESGFDERAVDDGRERREMRATRELRYDTAEDLVDVLREDDETRELAVYHNGR